MVRSQDMVVVTKDEYEDETTQSSSHKQTQDDRDDGASWDTVDSNGMRIHD